MKKEKWLVWKPMEGIPKTLHLLDLKYTYSGLTVNLYEEDGSPTLTIHFDGDLAHRLADEGDLLKTVSEAERTNEDRWTLYTVENSLYLKWFHEQSLNIRKKDNLVHYLIATPNEIIDVIDLSSPTLIWN